MQQEDGSEEFDAFFDVFALDYEVIILDSALNRNRTASFVFPYLFGKPESHAAFIAHKVTILCSIAFLLFVACIAGVKISR